MNAWPALQTMLYDGWVLRFANGYTRRANSVNPLYASARDVDEKIQACEALYRDKGLPVVFKMTAESQPRGLDTRLAARDYQVDALTSVQLLDLSHWEDNAAGVADLAPSETEEWQEAFCRLSRIAGDRQATLRQMLCAILPAKCFASVRVEGQIVACGLGVMQDGYVGLFDIVTDAERRRQGHGERLVRSLLSWSKAQGAHTAYLQVMLNNAPALRLYAKLGFREAYQYWYRVRL
jgi:ribosomal protein S18 acetylase RimI-like enzyme